MEKGSNVDRSNALNVYEVKPIRREFNYKFAAADVFNEFLYVGDEKGRAETMQATCTRTLCVRVTRK